MVAVAALLTFLLALAVAAATLGPALVVLPLVVLGVAVAVGRGLDGAGVSWPAKDHRGRDRRRCAGDLAGARRGPRHRGDGNRGHPRRRRQRGRACGAAHRGSDAGPSGSTRGRGGGWRPACQPAIRTWPRGSQPGRRGTTARRPAGPAAGGRVAGRARGAGGRGGGGRAGCRRWRRIAGGAHSTTDLLLVSNNPYAVQAAGRRIGRPRLAKACWGSSRCARIRAIRGRNGGLTGSWSTPRGRCRSGSTAKQSSSSPRSSSGSCLARSASGYQSPHPAPRLALLDRARSARPPRCSASPPGALMP
jgi:hypothetical protein